MGNWRTRKGLYKVREVNEMFEAEFNLYGPIKVEDDMDIIYMIWLSNLIGFKEGVIDDEEVNEKCDKDMIQIIAAVKAYLETR